MGTTVYLPCLNGPIAIGVTGSPPALRVQWRAPVGRWPALVAAGLVWTIGQDGVLYGLDPATGAVRQQATSAPRPTTSRPRASATTCSWRRLPTG